MPEADNLTIVIDGEITGTANALFAGPTEALSQQGLIRMWSDAQGQQEKHILYALAQRALIEYEDGELDIRLHPAGSPIEAGSVDLRVSLSEGAVLFADREQGTGIHAHVGVNIAAMLKAFHRYATRMIRLDVK